MRTFEIRRLALSEILDESFTIFRLGFVRFILFQLILYVPSTLALAFMFDRGGEMLIEMLKTGIVPPAEQLIVDVLAAFLTFFLLQTVVAAISTVALTRGVADTYMARPWTAGSILREALRLTPRAAAVGLIIGLVAFGFLAMPAGGFVIAGLIYGPQLAGAGLLVLVLLALMALVLILTAGGFGVFLFLRYGLASTVLAVEDTPIGRAFERSIELMKGRYLQALGLFLILMMLSALLGGVLSAFVPSPSFEGKDVDEIRRLLPQLIRGQILSAVLGQAIGVLTHTYSLICWTLFYFSTRCEKEGFDLAFLAGKVGGA